MRNTHPKRLSAAILRAILLFVLMLPASAVCTDSLPEIQINIHSLDKQLINIRSGDHDLVGDIIVNNIAAISLGSHVAVFDTGYYPQSASRLRRMIEDHFDAPIAYVINTHWHWDHVNGNHAFEGLTIIGQENIIRALQEHEAGMDTFLEQRRERQQYWAGQMEKSEEGSTAWENAFAWNYAHGKFLEEYKQGFHLVKPNIVFQNVLTIRDGGADIELRHLPFHTDNDLVAYLPKSDALIIGDQFMLDSVPWINPRHVMDLPEVIAYYKGVIDTRGVKHIINGHGPLMTVSSLEACIAYLEMIWQRLNADEANRGLLEIRLEDYIASEFSSQHDNHLANLELTIE